MNRMVIDREFCTSFDTNIHRWLEQMSGNYAEINERLMTQRLSALGVLLPISVLEKSVHDPRCVVTAEALRNHHYVGQSHPSIPSTASFPTWIALKSPTGIVNLLALTLRWASLFFSRIPGPVHLSLWRIPYCSVFQPGFREWLPGVQPKESEIAWNEIRYYSSARL